MEGTDSAETFKHMQEKISAALVQTTATAGRISQEDVSFQRSLDSNVSETLDRHSGRLLRLVQGLLDRAVDGLDVEAPRLKEQDDLENKWSGVVDVVDSLLERADTCLDVHTGRIKRLKLEETKQTKAAAPLPTRGRLDKLLRNTNIPKPQLLFTDTPHYDGRGTFRPLLRSKPHALVPLDESIISYTDNDGLEQNPYETEIINAQYPDAVYAPADPIPYKPFEETTATFVDTLEKFGEMLAELKLAKELAVDLEHHETRSYTGLVCLMQISTREKDWIVDTLKPWRAELQQLNQVFADPHILKVFHGAYMDISWLQRDFGVYVVSLFDTYHAARALGYPQASLASLLSRFVGFDADKQYQLADWRIRPLPEEMLKYARSDTHFLLYIYDHVRNELISRSAGGSQEASLIDEVIRNSKQTALLCYQGLVYDESTGFGPVGWYGMLKRSPLYLSQEQFAVFKAVHRWRDTVARAEDDGVNYIMPKHLLFAVARAMPMDAPSLFSACRPISQPVRARVNELLGVIRDAKAAGATGPEMADVLQLKDKAPTGVGEIVARIHLEKGAVRADDRDLASRPDPATGASSVRSDVSRFWGSTFGSSVWDPPRASGPVESIHEIRLALPLPPLTAEIFEESRAGATVPQEAAIGEPGSRAEHAFTRDRAKKEDTENNSGIFTVKQLGGSRKRKITDPAEAGGSSNGGHTNEAFIDLTNKSAATAADMDSGRWKQEYARAEAKEARKERKRQEKRLKREQLERELRNGGAGDDVLAHDNGDGGEGEGEGEGEAVGAFDYAAAAAAMQADATKTDRGRAPPAKGFNPYAKATDAPGPARRNRKEGAGRTMTFTR